MSLQHCRHGYLANCTQCYQDELRKKFLKSPLSAQDIIDTLIELNQTMQRWDHRGDAFRAVNDERDYQEYRWPGHKHEQEAYLTYIRAYSRKMEDLLSFNDNKDVHDEVQHIFRKIAALAIAAMEEHGVQRRKENPRVVETLTEAALRGGTQTVTSNSHFVTGCSIAGGNINSTPTK